MTTRCTHLDETNATSKDKGGIARPRSGVSARTILLDAQARRLGFVDESVGVFSPMATDDLVLDDVHFVFQCLVTVCVQRHEDAADTSTIDFDLALSDTRWQLT